MSGGRGICDRVGRAAGWRSGVLGENRESSKVTFLVLGLIGVVRGVLYGSESACVSILGPLVELLLIFVVSALSR